MLAWVNASAISAPKAGPPVICAVRPTGKPATAAVRSAATPSRSTIPDRSARMGTTAMAAWASADTTAGCGLAAPNGATTACIRSRAALAAFTSAEFSAVPSTRLTTKITGTRSPPGNWRDRASALAESEAVGTDKGAWPAAAFGPINNMKTIPSSAAPNPSCQERRPVTAAANPSHITMTSISVT